jgi:uncharacterized protein (TIGR00730 family)
MPRPIVTVFGSSSTTPSDAAWTDAADLGEGLARRGFDVATGGYGGTMEAVSLGARRGGGAAVGVTAPSLFPQRSGANRYVTREEPATSLTDRIGTLVAMSVATITLPGSIGTLTELMVAWNEQYIRRLRSRPTIPVLAVGAPWTELLPTIAVTTRSDISLVTIVESIEAVFDHIE